MPTAIPNSGTVDKHRPSFYHNHVQNSMMLASPERNGQNNVNNNLNNNLLFQNNNNIFSTPKSEFNYESPSKLLDLGTPQQNKKSQSDTKNNFLSNSENRIPLNHSG